MKWCGVFFLFVSLLFACQETSDVNETSGTKTSSGNSSVSPGKSYFCTDDRVEQTPNLSEQLEPLKNISVNKTGVYVLEQGEQAMISRAWLCENAETSIDVQYFIFASDNIGLIGSDLLLRAADRGVKVRILVDDIMVDATPKELLALHAHENISIKIYNPNANIGKNLVSKLYSAAKDFKGFNQRMHNKSLIVDQKVVITGGRNIADEYFDYDHDYNFRDRDLLLIGKAVGQVQKSFNDFWEHHITSFVSDVVDAPSHDFDSSMIFKYLHDYACNPDNFWPEIRSKMKEIPNQFQRIQASGDLVWVNKVRYVSDVPGKNNRKASFEGGGKSTDALVDLIKGAEKSISIQSPYLITTQASRSILADAIKRGVVVKILTNSLGSTDALEAFSGYQRDREKLLATGVRLYEFKPDAKSRIQLMNQDIHREAQDIPVFGLHAKTMVVDEKVSVVGTFNFDPRSSNLNTECVTIVHSEPVALRISNALDVDLKPENSWHITYSFNPDSTCTVYRQMKAKIRHLVPKIIL